MITKEDVKNYILSSNTSISDYDVESIKDINIHPNGGYVLIKYLTKDHQTLRNASIPIHYFNDVIRDRKINEILS
jgi:hypothetical protein